MFLPINGLINKGVSWIGGLRANGAGGEVCRNVSNFNGTSSYAQSANRIIDLDAVDPSFSITVWYDLEGDGTLVSQNFSSSSSNREFQIYNLSGNLRIILGGGPAQDLINDVSEFIGYGYIRVDYDHSSGIARTYKNDVLIAKSDPLLINAVREPAATFKIMARGSGALAAFYAEGEQKNVAVIHNGLDLFWRMDESVFEGDGTIIYKTIDNNSSYEMTGYNITVEEQCGNNDPSDPVGLTLVMFGASILEYSFEETSLVESTKNALGLDYLTVANRSVAGSTAADYLTRIDSVLEEYGERGNIIFFVHGFGNNVSNTRPYSTATQTEIDEFQDAMDLIIDKIQAENHTCLWAGITYRDYTSNFPDESYGSLPYNTNIVYPTIQSRLGSAWEASVSLPYWDLYNLFKDNPQYLLPDGIHQNEEGRQALREYILSRFSSYLSNHYEVGGFFDGQLYIDGEPWND